MPGNPLLVLANREEAYARPATGPLLHPARGPIPAWLGGVDLLAGGTWLGINAHGLLAAVTNRRREIVPLQPRSRGLLCRSLLAFHSVAAASRSAIEQLQQDRFAGCNLLIASRDEATVIEAADELKATPLPPGLHLITNAALNDPTDARISRVRSELERAAPVDPISWSIATRRICALRRDAHGPAIWLEGPDRGTVSSTIVTLAERPDDTLFFHAPRARSPVVHDDQTPLLHGLLTGSSAEVGSHRIHLRGPWDFEPVAGAQRGTDGSIDWSRRDLPPRGTVQLPVPWSTFLETFRGRVVFRRRFHRPNNLEPHERVAIVLEGVIGTGRVSLNGHSRGAIVAETHSFCADVTGLLAANNELVVELEFTARADETTTCPPWQTAALAIQATPG